MAVLGEIRKRPWLLMGAIAIALLAFLVNPDSLDKVFGKNPSVLGKVNGEEITRDEFNDELIMMRQQAQQQGRPVAGLEEQVWQNLVQAKLIRQEFEKQGFEMNDEYFWSQIQYIPMFAQNPQNFDEKGNFKLQEIKKQIESLHETGGVEQYNQWLKARRQMEYQIMARQVFSNIGVGVTTSKKEVSEMVKRRDQLANIDFVKVDYTSFLQKNPIKVTTEDLSNYIKKHPTTYKAEASRNLGLVYFPASPSAADDAIALKEINNLFTGGTDASGGKENFMNTTNDSMFVTSHSDASFNNTYVNISQLPQSIKGFVETASVGQTYGPYKEQDYYVVSKLLGKKPSDSTLSRHILIAYKGTQAAGANVTRSKEEAKKLADSIGAAIKADPNKFTQFISYSADTNSAAQGGSLGWTTPETPFVPEFLTYLNNNPKGATGVVETQFGYHIINIQDKKSGAMTYKVANLVKAIKASQETDNTVDKNARRFIQQAQGKSFNDFANLAKKSNFKFFNPTAVGRFDGALQGIGTDIDEEVITWAFDKKREKGEVQIFSEVGTGGKIVAYLNGKQEAGLSDPESVRAQIEPIVLNELAGKKIIEKITAAKATSLDQVAKLFGASKQTADVNMLNPNVGGAMEPKVAGAAFGVTKGKVSNPVQGATGVYVVVKKSETTNKQPGDEAQIAQAISQQNASMFTQQYMRSLQDNADIKDYRIEVWDKTQ